MNVFIPIAFLFDIELNFEIEFLFDNEFDYESLVSLPIKKTMRSKRKQNWREIWRWVVTLEMKKCGFYVF